MQLTRVQLTNPVPECPKIPLGHPHHSPSQEPMVTRPVPHQHVLTHYGRGRVTSGPAPLGAVPRETPTGGPSEGLERPVAAILRPVPHHGREGHTCQGVWQASSVQDTPAQDVSPVLPSSILFPPA